jgi:DNA-binding NarL/FixJ family response regulator
LPRVLIADDNEAVRQTLVALFNGADGWVVCGVAANGTEAVALAATLKPDILLLDFQMPGKNGLEAAAEILKTQPALPIALYTLHQSPQLQSQGESIGIRKVISKSDMFSALIPSLLEILPPRPEGPLGPIDDISLSASAAAPLAIPEKDPGGEPAA